MYVFPQKYACVCVCNYHFPSSAATVRMSVVLPAASSEHRCLCRCWHPMRLPFHFNYHTICAHWAKNRRPPLTSPNLKQSQKRHKHWGTYSCTGASGRSIWNWRLLMRLDSNVFHFFWTTEVVNCMRMFSIPDYEFDFQFRLNIQFFFLADLRINAKLNI